MRWHGGHHRPRKATGRKACPLNELTQGEGARPAKRKDPHLSLILQAYDQSGVGSLGYRVRVLLDTHTLLWWLEGGTKLSQHAHQTIQNQETIVLVSAATAWEIAIKSHAGKLDAGPLIADFCNELKLEGFHELPISAEHGIRAGLLKGRHKDPFDCMLAAQAQAENLALVSNDRSFDVYAVRRIW